MLRTLGCILKDALFPCFCVSCATYLERRDGRERAICDECRARIGPAPREEVENLVIYPGGRYETPELRALVCALKYERIQSAAEPLAEIIAHRIARESIFARSNEWLIVPVPLHAARERWRGFNHAALIAKRVSALTGTACAPEVIIRTRNTPPQVSLREKRERRKNVEYAFAARASCARLLHKRRILLLDDVKTTGATLIEAAKALRGAGASEVVAAVAAQAQGRDDVRRN